MKTVKRKLSLGRAGIALAVALSSCNAADDGEGAGFTYTIDIDGAEEAKPLPLSELCDGIATIILETTERSLLSRVDKVVRANDRLYVFDRYGNSMAGLVAEFDMDGRFIRRIGNAGRGPGEYSRVSDFAVDGKSGTIRLLDTRTGRVISYGLDDGRYIGEVSFDESGKRGSAIVSVGDVMYSHPIYNEFDVANYMLRSWNVADTSVENHYLPIGERLPGWTNTTMVNNGNFIFARGNDHALFSDRYSPEIFKLTSDGVENYIYVRSADFIDEAGRRAVSDALNSDARSMVGPGGGPPVSTYGDVLRTLDRFHEVRDYFETEGHIGFYIARGGGLHGYMYDKRGGKTREVSRFYNDLVITGREDTAIHTSMSLFGIIQADGEGLFLNTRQGQIEQLRTAARDGALADDLDRLEELKELPDNSNPVIFYLKFKEPLR